ARRCRDDGRHPEAPGRQAARPERRPRQAHGRPGQPRTLTSRPPPDPPGLVRPPLLPALPLPSVRIDGPPGRPVWPGHLHTRTARERAADGPRSRPGGHVAGSRSLPWPTLALLAVAAAAPAAPAAEIVRLNPSADGTTPLELGADEIYSWTDAGREVYLLGGHARVQQDRTEIRGDRAVVWLDADARKAGKPVRVVMYTEAAAGKKVRLERTGEQAFEAPSAVVELVTPRIGQVRGKVYPGSPAGLPLYQEALKPRGKPAPAATLPAPAPELADERSPRTGLSFLLPAAWSGQPAPKGPGDPVVPSVPPGTTMVVPVPLTEERRVWISPRSTQPFNFVPVTVGKETAYIVTGGIKLQVKFATGSIRSLEIEADQVVIWQKEGDSTGTFNAMRGPEGSEGAEKIEIYLTGNVVLHYGAFADVTRTGVQRASRTLRADRVYYDVGNHRAIAVRADLEYMKEGYINAGHVLAQEIYQIGETEWAAVDAEIHASRLPSDPGVKL